MSGKAIEAAVCAVEAINGYNGDRNAQLAQAAVQAYLAVMEAEGPTEAMIEAGVEVAGMPIASVVPQGEDADRYMVRLIWQHMLAARPNVKG